MKWQCPQCGCKYGYYENHIQATRQYFNRNGEPQPAGFPHYVRGGARKYCKGCDKDITGYVNQFLKEKREG